MLGLFQDFIFPGKSSKELPIENFGAILPTAKEEPRPETSRGAYTYIKPNFDFLESYIFNLGAIL